MANEVFISYSRRNRKKVRKIKEEIEREVGIKCWMDLDGIESYAQFEEAIIDAINRHDTMLFMMSESSMKSKYARKELDFAVLKGKRIVLIKLDKAPMPDNFSFNYQKQEQIDWGKKEEHEKLINDLKKWFPNGVPVPSRQDDSPTSLTSQEVVPTSPTSQDDGPTSPEEQIRLGVDPLLGEKWYSKPNLLTAVMAFLAYTLLHKKI